MGNSECNVRCVTHGAEGLQTTFDYEFLHAIRSLMSDINKSHAELILSRWKSFWAR
jgi:hypothetical protein